MFNPTYAAVLDRREAVTENQHSSPGVRSAAGLENNNA